MIKLKRVYGPEEKGDGVRILVDRIWPRGIKKGEKNISLWLREVAPSNDLRKWFGHKPERWEEFCRRYHHEVSRDEGKIDAVKEIVKASKKGNVTLVFSAKDRDHNNAVALRQLIEELARAGLS